MRYTMDVELTAEVDVAVAEDEALWKTDCEYIAALDKLNSLLMK